MKLRWLALQIAVLPVLVAGLEIAARAWDWGRLKDLPPRLDERLNIGPRLSNLASPYSDATPDLDTIMIEFKRYPYYLKTNSQGFRGSDELDPNRPTILALGASVTFGTYVSDQDTYPFLLQSVLNERAGSRSSYQVMNGAMPGYGLGSALDFLREKGSSLKPQIVLLQVGTGVATESRDEPDLFRKSVDKPAALDGLKRYLSENLAIASIGRRIKHKWAEESALKDAALKDEQRTDTSERARHVMFAPDTAEARRAWASAGARLKELGDLVASWGGKLYLVVFPLMEQIADPTYPDTPQAEIKKMARESGAGFVDALTTMRGADIDGATLHWYPHDATDFKYSEYSVAFPKPFRLVRAGDGHYSRYGHILIARAIADALSADGVLPNGVNAASLD